MNPTIIHKLKIKPGDQLLVLSAPANFKKELGQLPTGAAVVSAGSDYQQVHWFVLNKAQMEKELNKVMKLLKEGVTVWVHYPKFSSKIQTDLTRDKGWEALLSKEDQLAWINLVSFNKTWSAFGFRLKTNMDKKKEESKQPREILNWVNPATKEVRLPDELAVAFKTSNTAADKFAKLSFTNKKEYVEWIVTAKQHKTKEERIKGTIERLEKGWKNPRNL